ncbi:transcriptional regulator, DeoR family [Beutenbergia cavernae DSM 12333]|uniref:Transcriptional regulator, DeoR family n=1 Tax=Beutenbergia cavernae (strain ATCC BAA-8 / DSM 12333 / CCUG 43141 / JCM 11478 / NBRC 16432 / NCIMB 13614 / HKI 0122) TaxID=471853 RepID=C5C1C1_BEUC1|nr:sugar-binding domain-containing protein [Beutenbergia cavernae]ACQ81531.1 transcriptional regulator, DeoR family [Beutenbergia cavernae DSM 12333]
MDARDELMHEVASMYYLQDQTMEGIARRLGVSRSTVSRLIKSARAQGLVRISLRSPSSGTGTAARLRRTFGVRAHVVPIRASASQAARLDEVARVSARLLAEWFASGMTLGVAWGTTVAAVSRQLVPTPIHDATVVQLNGAANTHSSGLAYANDLVSSIARAFDATIHHFPVPAFFDYAATKEMMWRERSVRHVLQVQAQADVALFGVGALAGTVPSHVYSSGYLDDADRRALAGDRVVGDVCTVFLREDGSWEDIAINARATGPTPRELRRIPRRVCVVAGDSKVVPLLAALRAGAATDLVVDESTARALLRRSALPLGESPA